MDAEVLMSIRYVEGGGEGAEQVVREKAGVVRRKSIVAEGKKQQLEGGFF